MKLVAILIPVTMSLLLSLFHFPKVSADCCQSTCNNWCKNCKKGTPYCGTGPCNFLGCGCDCHTGPCDSSRMCQHGRMCLFGGVCLFGRRKRDIYSNGLEEFDMHQNVSHIIKAADVNSDGKLDLVETIGFLKLKNTAHLQDIEIERAFRELDKNGDQFLSDYEIDNKF